MHSQEDRDVVTLSIATSLVIFTVVAAVGAGLLFLLDLVVGDRAFHDVSGYVVVGCASAVALVYLWRHRRP